MSDDDDDNDLAELDEALGLLHHDPAGWYGAQGRSNLLMRLGDIDPITYRVVRTVAVAPNGSIRMRHIAELLLCDRARATRVVHRLADRDLLTIRVDPVDTRERRVGLGPAGQDLIVESDLRRRQLLKSAVEDWPPEDIALLTELVSRLHHSFDRTMQLAVSPSKPGETDARRR